MEKNLYTLKPMLLEQKEKPFNDSNWIFEYKWDGFRALIFIEHEIKIISRNQKNLTYYFPELTDIKKFFPKGTVLDGEIIAYNGKKGCFTEILRRTRSSIKTIPIKFVIFDILAKNYQILLKEPLLKRKELLPRLNERCIFTASFIHETGIKAFETAQINNYEGIVAKKKDSLYFPGKRTSGWIKIKNFTTENFIVVGLRLLNGLPHTLIISDNQNSFKQEIVMPGTLDKKEEWLKLFRSLVLEVQDNVLLLQPVLGVKISYLEKTTDGKLRHAKIHDFLPL